MKTQIIALAFILFSQVTWAATSPDPLAGLSEEERESINFLKVDSHIFQRKNIVFAWPKSIPFPKWESILPASNSPLAGLNELQSPSDLADLTQRIYEIMASPKVFNFDPQVSVSPEKGKKTRLVIGFVQTQAPTAKKPAPQWEGCWQSGNFISLCDPQFKEMGLRKRIGLWFHEMTHYFHHFSMPGNEEGFANFMVYGMAKQIGWSANATEWRDAYYTSCFDSSNPVYNAGAGALVELFEKKRFTTLIAFIDYLRRTGGTEAFAPVWQYMSLPGLKQAANAYCKDERGFAKIDATVKQNLKSEVLSYFHDLFRLQDLLGRGTSVHKDPTFQAWLPNIRQTLARLEPLNPPFVKNTLIYLRKLEENSGVSAHYGQRMALLTNLLGRAVARRTFNILNEKPQPLKKYASVSNSIVGTGLRLTAAHLPQRTNTTPRLPTSTLVEKVVESPMFPGLTDFQRVLHPSLKENFTMWGKGYVEIMESGRYVIAVGSDDGSFVRLHDEELIDNDGLHGYQIKLVEVELEKGLHPLRFGFMQAGGGAAFTLHVIPIEIKAQPKWRH